MLPTWRWLALSLCEGNGAPGPKNSVLRLDHGKFEEANVFEEETCRHLLEDYSADLVTADGAAEMEHENLEYQHFPLLVAESRLALMSVANGGTVVIKFFEGLKRCTLVWIAWMTTFFDTVSVIKPTSSRPTNSELYLVCRSYNGRALIDTPTTVRTSNAWIKETRTIMERHALSQSAAIEAVFKRIDFLVK